jgi:hypothetical protein
VAKGPGDVNFSYNAFPRSIVESGLEGEIWDTFSTLTLGNILSLKNIGNNIHKSWA